MARGAAAAARLRLLLALGAPLAEALKSSVAASARAASARSSSAAAGTSVRAIEGYSTNAICRQRHCTNPIFPGLQDLAALEGGGWQCQPADVARQQMQFCRAAVKYDVALPVLNESATAAEAVRSQEIAAATAYRYHLATMNIEAWEHRHPEESSDDCVKAIWTMVCQTYFPKAEAGCEPGQSTAYLRPCKNVCQSYVQACGVECCDESAKCVFAAPAGSEREALVARNASASLLSGGYYDELGPSARCTGAATRSGGSLALAALLPGLAALLASSSSSWPSGGGRGAPAAAGRGRHSAPAGPRGHGRLWALAAVLALAAGTLQGCNVLGHAAAAWEMRPSYLVDFQYIPLATTERQTGKLQLAADQEAVANSCELVGIPAERQCSGHGVCKPWGAAAAGNPAVAPLSFCECDRDWADPECRTRRKSQATAFALSLSAGFLGADRFYLGQYFYGLLKLVTLGGLGSWWLVDVVYIGASPIYAYQYRLAADLPHWVFVTASVGVFAALGVYFLNVHAPDADRHKRTAKMLLEAEDDFFRARGAPAQIRPKDRVGMPVRATHLVPAPVGGLYGTVVPPEVRAVSHGNPYASFTTYANVFGDPALISGANMPVLAGSQ